MTKLTKFETAYLKCALWSSLDESNDNGGNPLDDNYSIDDIDIETIDAAKRDCDAFISKAGPLLDDLDDSQAGHDFWLTRNYHGAGFWDRGIGETGDKLTDIAQSFEELNPFVHNGKIIIE
jgi:hypothetical protein